MHYLDATRSLPDKWQEMKNPTKTKTKFACLPRLGGAVLVYFAMQI
jgi:hypothetical protein